MGVRRKSRARIAAINKAGLKKDVTPSPLVMSDNIVEASQFRMGQMVITDMVLDLASTKNTLYSQAIAAADPIGTNTTNVSYVCNLSESVFGIVTSVETVSLEQPTDGTLKDYDLVKAGDGTLDGDPSSGNDGYLGSDATGDAALITDIGITGASAIGVHKTTAIDDRSLQNRYLYITAGAATTKRASCTIDTSGVTGGIANLTTAITAIQLKRGDGTTPVNFVADSGTSYNGSAQADKFNIGSATDTAKLAQGIAIGINNHANFSATPVDGSSTTITVTRVETNAATTENSANILVEGYATTGITITDFSGGIPNEITAGKVLIRVTGHMEPDDL